MKVWMISAGLAAATLSAPAMAQFDYSPGFDAGPAAEIEGFEALQGDWTIELFIAGRDDTAPEGWGWVPWGRMFATDQDGDGVADPGWEEFGRGTSHIEPIMRGVAFREFNSGFPIPPGSVGAEGYSHWAYSVQFSYDRFRDVHRLVVLDNLWGLSDIYEGEMTAAGGAFSNFDTQTYNTTAANGQVQKGRIVIRDIEADAFILEWWQLNAAQFVDGASGEDQPWRPSVRMVYSRAE